MVQFGFLLLALFVLPLSAFSQVTSSQLDQLDPATTTVTHLGKKSYNKQTIYLDAEDCRDVGGNMRMVLNRCVERHSIDFVVVDPSGLMNREILKVTDTDAFIGWEYQSLVVDGEDAMLKVFGVEQTTLFRRDYNSVSCKTAKMIITKYLSALNGDTRVVSCSAFEAQ